MVREDKERSIHDPTRSSIERLSPRVRRGVRVRIIKPKNDKSIDSQSRAIICYAMEINDPWVARPVRRAETIVDNLDFEETPETKIEIMRAF